MLQDTSDNISASNGSDRFSSVNVPLTFTAALSLTPTFFGNTKPPSVRPFFEALEKVADRANLSKNDKLLLATSKFSEDASDFLNNAPDIRALIDYDEFKHAIISRFENRVPLTLRMQQFSNCIQLPNESIMDYSTRLKALAHYCYPQDETNASSLSLIDRQKLCQFLTGLCDNLKRYVLSADPQTFQDAIDVALKEETNSKLMSPQFNVNAVSNDPQPKNNQFLDLCALMTKQLEDSHNLMRSMRQKMIDTGGGYPQSTQQQHRNDFDPQRENFSQRYQPAYNSRHQTFTPQQRPPRQNTIICYFCGKPNHYARDCYTRLRQQANDYTAGYRNQPPLHQPQDRSRRAPFQDSNRSNTQNSGNARGPPAPGVRRN